jgi:hypothetical protein
LVATLERTVESHAGDRFAVGVKTQEEEGDTVSVFKVLTAKRSLEAPISIDSFGPVQIELPQIRSLVGMMAFESNPGRLVHET